uniref:Up-regulator of cell proliferation-like domain-containing protein n=1 Tax=Varanus komodoensis TaxID=61221 RepID=A0A8D2LPI7_VARKO
TYKGPQGMHKEQGTSKKGDPLKDILSKLKLEEQKSEKLSLQEVLEISSEGLKQCTPQRLEDLPWHFLRKVLALNVTARSTGLEQGGVKDLEEKGIAEETTFESLFFSDNTNESISLNPLDVLCAKWRPHSMAESRGFREESLVMASMLTISFVRMGNLNFSKSKFLNEFLSPSQQHHNYFMHQDMEYGDIPRKIADGLVEMAWYFPGGEENSDLFPEPVAVANLCGDIESHRMQFSFLTQVSSAVFVFAKHISEHECNVLSSLKGSATQYFLILEERCRESSQSVGFLKKVVAELNLKPSDILLKNAMRNQAEFVKKLRSIVGRIINAPFKCSSIKEMADVARKLSIQADEDCQDCQNALQCAEQITKEIKDVVKYKEETLKLQGVLWKKLAETQRELCRMKKLGDKTLEKYRSELIARISELREKQNQCDLPSSLTNFIVRIKQTSPSLLDG